MSQNIQAKGYTVANGVITDVNLNETVFAYPTVYVSISPTTGDTNTKFTLTSSTSNDIDAGPLYESWKLDGVGITKPTGTMSFAAGTHAVSVMVQDSNQVMASASVSFSVTPVVVPPTATTVMGCSPGTMGMSKMLTTFNPHIVRVFTPGDLAAIPAGVRVCYSNDGGHNRGYDLDGATVGSAGYNAWTKELSALRDDNTHYVIWGHEEDIHGNDYVKLRRVYQGGRLVVDNMNKTRKFPIKLVVATTGMPYNDTSYKNWGFPEADGIGADNYSRSHWDILANFAKSLGKFACAPETGVKAGTSGDANTYSDAQKLAAMRADYALYATKYNYEFTCVFLGLMCDLQGDPLSTAQLKAYCASSGK